MTVLLSAQALSKVYGPRRLFVDISLDLRVGEHVGLIGPNGSGKSTLLRILAGIETPDHGTVALRRTARLGYLPQEPAFALDHSVFEVLTDALEDDDAEQHEQSTQIRTTLSKVGFSDGDQKVSTLSGGWRK